MLIRFFLFFSLFITLSCRDRIPKKQVNKNTSKKEVKYITPSLKIYIEDGGSMEGFFKDPNFDFSSDLSTLFSQLTTTSKQLNLISNSNILNLTSSGGLDFSKYLSNLNAFDRNLDESSFETMFDSVIYKSKRNTVTAFVSDFIQSSNDLTNPIAGDYISNLLSKKIQGNKNFSVCVLKMKSRFQGKFYYVSANRKNILPNPDSIDQIKPYYIWFFGDNEMIEKLNLNQKSIKMFNLAGFEDFSIYNEKKYGDNDKPINWTVLQFTNSIGTFKPARNRKTIEGVHDIENVKPVRETNEFQICIGIDLSSIPVSDEYKLDANNYKIESNGFKIERICILNGDNYDFNGKAKIDSKDLNLLSKVKPTHLLFLKSNEKIVDNLEISLRRNISPILLQSNSDDESNLKNLKTYGFQNFTEAIKKSFPHYNENSFYFTKKISIENKKGGFSWLMTLLVIVFIGVIISIIIKNKK